MIRVPKSVVSLLRRIESSEEKELVWERGNGWWVGYYRVRASTCKLLLQFCLISEDQFSTATMKRFTLNGYGRKVLSDPDNKVCSEVESLLREVRWL